MMSLSVESLNVVTPPRAPITKISTAMMANAPRPIGGFQLRTAARSRTMGAADGTRGVVVSTVLT